jgi:hypothetical protein
MDVFVVTHKHKECTWLFSSYLKATEHIVQYIADNYTGCEVIVLNRIICNFDIAQHEFNGTDYKFVTQRDVQVVFEDDENFAPN